MDIVKRLLDVDCDEITAEEIFLSLVHVLQGFGYSANEALELLSS